jgi:hypothetical protein
MPGFMGKAPEGGYTALLGKEIAQGQENCATRSEGWI